MFIQPKLVQWNRNPSLLWKCFLFPLGYNEGASSPKIPCSHFQITIGEGWWECYQLLGTELKFVERKNKFWSSLWGSHMKLWLKQDLILQFWGMWIHKTLIIFNWDLFPNSCQSITLNTWVIKIWPLVYIEFNFVQMYPEMIKFLENISS